MLRAIMALTAGSTVLTPTSQGNINVPPELGYFVVTMYISMTPVITYDACHVTQLIAQPITRTTPMLLNDMTYAKK
jgi:hypothetical protein